MSLKMIRISFFTVAFLLFSSLAFAQVGSIAGKVIGEDGQPLKDALVKIERQDVKGNYKVKSNKKGEYFHAGLPLGTYKVSVEINGETRESVNGVKVSMGDPTPINFNLAELKKKQQAANTGGAPSDEQLRGMSEAERKAYEEALEEAPAADQQEQRTERGIQRRHGRQGNQRLCDRRGETAKPRPRSIPTQHVIWANLADSQIALSQTKTGDERTQMASEAIASYDKAIAAQPENAAYYNNKGLALVRIGKIDEGKVALTKAAELDPANGGRYYFNLGAIMVNSNNTEGAVEAFKKATEIDPKYAEAYYQLGTAMVGKAEMKENGTIVPVPGTVEAFQKYVELSPTGPNVEAAKSMIASLTGSVDTSFDNTKKKK